MSHQNNVYGVGNNRVEYAKRVAVTPREVTSMTTPTHTIRTLALYGDTVGNIRRPCDGGVGVDSHPRTRFDLVVA